MLQWLRSQDPPCRWNEGCTYEAAELGDLPILQFLHEQAPPCPWRPDCTAGAARGGHLDVMNGSADRAAYLMAQSTTKQHVGTTSIFSDGSMPSERPFPQPTDPAVTGYSVPQSSCSSETLASPFRGSWRRSCLWPGGRLAPSMGCCAGAAVQSRTPAGVSSMLLVLLHHVAQARTSSWGCPGCPWSLPIASQSWQVCSMIPLADSGLSQDRCLGTAQA